MSELINRFYASDASLSELLNEIGNLSDPFEKTLLAILLHIDEQKAPDEEMHKRIDEATKMAM